MVTGRRIPPATRRDLWLEQCPGLDHYEKNTHRPDDPERVLAESVYVAIAWARGQRKDPPSG
jgi:hypothetical protein